MSLAALEAKIEKEVTAYNQLQKEYSKIVSGRQTLESQLKENELVQTEFELLDDEATIYKMIGPVLVKQEQAEAKTNVKKRLDFIRSEINRAEKQIKDLDVKLEKKKIELMSLQTEFQKRKEAASA
ncbi:hypothetical protein AMAG_02216 [Allomyces macrogynus ATCC 38327]|uniref:Prefoldin, beta subunit n=1 Tax=Allomyces macrogynus (strain ATCC 38327) TaxID=578462 RepID=A0A0L0S1F1_ALLM3|nr:hypothetical protein GGF31_005906 [Allomyces arbusculus]KNE56407.1 hypothetical protein AMAG_02216 [Allomyces macrogynus ATCC 38327]|eukprot:KNE56407.1 hypothetical protein AMAG_02216 [Allomyces macrogynus ATCC 38327]